MDELKLLIKGFSTNLVFTAILFVSAGRLNYYQGWLFLVANIISTLMNYGTIRKNPGLLNERATLGEGIKSWDKLLLGLSAIVYLLIIITAGFDSGRHPTTIEFNWITGLTGFLLFILGQVLFLTARSQNNYFSSFVRIQKDRGHAVCDTGLYKIVRHPGYLGMIFSLAAIPLITTSLWSLIPTGAAITLLVIRTILEDQVLINELEGYINYTQKTPYKLIPKIW